MSLLNLPKELKEYSDQMRILRSSQKWVSSQEAYDQCRRVEKMAALAEDSSPPNTPHPRCQKKKIEDQVKNKPPNKP